MLTTYLLTFISRGLPLIMYCFKSFPSAMANIISVNCKDLNI